MRCRQDARAEEVAELQSVYELQHQHDDQRQRCAQERVRRKVPLFTL